MSKKLVLVALVLAFCLTGVAQAAKIILISDSDEPGGGDYHDDSLVAFLENLGHTVDTSGMNDMYRDGQDPFNDPVKSAALEDADLVIVSRRTDSGSYDDNRTNWNTLETPLLLMSAYLTRGGGDNRWNWTPGGSGDAGLDVTDIEIEPDQEGHPFLTGLTGPIAAFDWSTSPGGQCPKGVYLPNDDFVEGAVLIGRFDGRPMLADIPAGTTFANGDVTGERRAFLGHWGYDTDVDGPDGTYSEFEHYITDDYKALLTNIINDMLGILDPEAARNPKPDNGTTVDMAKATPLSWAAGETAARHDVYFGTDFEDVNNADTSDTTGIYRDRQNLVIFTPAEALKFGGTYYWRIDEVEADGTTIHTGNIWSFSILDYILVDDFEDYNTADNQIWYAWHDGLGYGEPAVPPYFAGNGTGAAVGDETTNSFAEETIVHSGSQSMPYWYNNNKQGYMKYSEATKTLTGGRDWTEQGVKALSLWFRGYPAYLGGFTEAPAGTYTMSAEGADIWGASDQFHFAWQELSGSGTIVAKVESVENTNDWAKAGIMIRDSLDPDSVFAMVAVTPGSGVWFGRRTAAGNASDAQADITAPQWVKIERSIGGLVRASYSADGSTWTPLGSPVPVIMNTPMYIGLALTSHSSGVACEAVFSNVTSNGTGQWVNQDIGLTSNEAEPMYVVISNKNGTTGIVYHEDPNATLMDTWTEWNIDLKDFQDQGVDLSDVNSITVGIGDKNNLQPGGSGKMYFDDIGLYKPRYVPDKVTPFKSDFTGDGVVDFDDLEIMVNDWLDGDYTVYAETPQPAIAWWKFDNNANDSIGGHHGQLYGNPTYVAGMVGSGAIELDGTGDYVSCPNDAAFEITEQITVAAWIKVAVFDKTWQAIVTKGDDSWRLHRWGDNNSLSWNCNGVTGGSLRAHSTDIGIGDGQWHHVAGIYDSSKMYLYVDGMLDNSQDASGSIDVGVYPVMIGGNAQQTSREWNGLIDDVRIYDYALSLSEILDLVGQSELYVPLTSPANISDEEPANSKKVNFRDFAILADEWLQQSIWPEW